VETSTTKRDTGNTQAGETQRPRFRLSLELAGEIVLLLLVGAFFTYLFVESLSWPLGAALMPWILLSIGVPFWLYRLAFLIFRAKEESSQIMDIGFRLGDDSSGARARFIRICSFIVGLYLAIWLFGFHVALPLGILFYVRVYGEVGWGWSLVVALLFLAILIGVYDKLLHATWHEPPVLQWLYSFLPESG
jgi:hypothetical protein